MYIYIYLCVCVGPKNAQFRNLYQGCFFVEMSKLGQKGPTKSGMVLIRLSAEDSHRLYQ